MNNRFQAKSDLYVFLGYVLIAIALAFNPLTFPLWQSQGLIPPVSNEFMHAADVLWGMPLAIDALLILFGALMVWAPKHLMHYLNNHLWFGLLVFALLLWLQFSTNPILPGKYRIFRLLLMLVALFFLTNALYLGIVKDYEKRHIQPFFRNLAVALFGIMIVLALLESVFMFVKDTHRFNGTLASRAWFLENWKLNSMGYRDVEHDSAKVASKTKVMVLGDSFVAGHGVKNPEDRFSGVIAKALGDDYAVFNMGVGGSDVRDAMVRMREFPFVPDHLIFSYYPNDIEQDGEWGGLKLQRAQSYTDVIGPVRYFIRRSYLLNYLYWRFPHPNELQDYKGYIRQCYAYEAVMMKHKLALDDLVHYADSVGATLTVVVFPFLEDAAGSGFATEPIMNHFELKGIRPLDVRQWMLGKSADDFIVNRNDPHPNENLHRMVGDSLLKVLKGR